MSVVFSYIVVILCIFAGVLTAIGQTYNPVKVPSITPIEMPPEVVGPFVAVFLGGLFIIFAVVLLFVIKHHKRKLELQQEAINLQYLNADIDSDADDDLLDKYNEKV